MKKIFFVLHGHLPWVLHHHNKNYEKSWVFEITAECHLRLLESLHKTESAKVAYSISPTLLSMWVSNNFKQEFESYLLKQLYIAEQEVKRTLNTEFEDVTKFYLDFWQKRYLYWQKIDGDLIKDYYELHSENKIELLTSAASHPILPLLPSHQWINLQLKTSVNLFQNIFSLELKSFWLPECAISEDILPALEENNIENVFVAEHVVTESLSETIIKKGNLRLFLRDIATAEQVWSREIGYPGHPLYREYYRDIGWDLPFDQLKEYLTPWEFKRFTGFKYYSISDKQLSEKRIYNYQRACQIIEEQAQDFINLLLKHSKDKITCIYDAELFGHWWFEGPDWLTKVLQKQGSLSFTTPNTFDEPVTVKNEINIRSCSWGEKGFFDVWLNEKNEWMYKQVIGISYLVEQNIDYLPVQKKELLLRLVLLLQGSDWPFMVYYNSSSSYAQYRFNVYCEDIKAIIDNRPMLTNIEEISSFLPGLNLNKMWFKNKFIIEKPTVLLLAWEYPPLTVGGLATHVYYLSKYLQEYINVHVITRGSSYMVEQDGNLTIHRVPLPSYENQDFLNWILLLNMKFTKYILNNFLFKNEQVIIHAHDWLVGLTGITLQQKKIGHLIATIHATEYGRQKGELNSISCIIHKQEGLLINNAEKIIVCSNYMRNEVIRLFNNNEKISLIPNGIEFIAGEKQTDLNMPEKYILFYGRLVPEKGVQTLIYAFNQISPLFPELHLIIGGKGFYEENLRSIANSFSCREKIKFMGFLNNSTRDFLLAKAQIVCFPSIYEPFGIVALEAMAAEKPVIAGKTGGLGEIIEDEVTGLLFEPENVLDLANKLKIFLTDKKIANRCATNAKKMVLNKYNWRNIAEKTYKLYQKILYLREEK